jgi:hypothetical protein
MMPDEPDFKTEAVRKEAGKVDPDGFENLETLTKKLLAVTKKDMDTARKNEPDPLLQGLAEPETSG